MSLELKWPYSLVGDHGQICKSKGIFRYTFKTNWPNINLPTVISSKPTYVMKKSNSLEAKTWNINLLNEQLIHGELTGQCFIPGLAVSAATGGRAQAAWGPGGATGVNWRACGKLCSAPASGCHVGHGPGVTEHPGFQMQAEIMIFMWIVLTFAFCQTRKIKNKIKTNTARAKCTPYVGSTQLVALRPAVSAIHTGHARTQFPAFSWVNGTQNTTLYGNS